MLDLLQSHQRLTGVELARRLEVNVRTARRYVEMLQDLGIPAEAERGRYGAYHLRPDFKLPPLMFSEDEALAVTLGLLAVRRLGLAVAAPAAEGALAKVDQVLPAGLRAQVRAVQETLVLHLGGPRMPPLSATVLALSTAAGQARRVRLRYRAWNGEESERTIDPYGVVYHAGIWYAAGHCHLRGALRVFRLDRVLAADVSDAPERFTRPAGFDSLNVVLCSLAAAPRAWPVVVLLSTTLAEALRYIPPSLAALEETPDGVVMRCSTDDLDWIAGILAGLQCDIVVQEPAELRAALQRLAARLLQMAGPGRP